MPGCTIVAVAKDVELSAGDDKLLFIVLSSPSSQSCGTSLSDSFVGGADVSRIAVGCEVGLACLLALHPTR